MDDAFEVTEVQQTGEKTILPTIKPELEQFIKGEEELTAFQVSQKILHNLLLQKERVCFELEDKLEQLPDEHRREKRSFYLKLLAVMDSIDRMINAADPENELVHDVETIRNQFFLVLEETEIFPIEVQVGKAFDPATCETAGSRLRPDLAPTTIIQVERRGYNWQEKVLRKARVIISKQN